jgi:hypothetical protein
VSSGVITFKRSQQYLVVLTNISRPALLGGSQFVCPLNLSNLRIAPNRGPTLRKNVNIDTSLTTSILIRMKRNMFEKYGTAVFMLVISVPQFALEDMWVVPRNHIQPTIGS